MKTRAVISMVAVAGLASLASARPEVITYSVHTEEVVASSNTLVGSPNGQIDTGEGLRLSVDINVQPAFGTPVSYTPPPGTGQGTMEGLASIFFDILATNALGGTWSLVNRAASPDTPGMNWGLGGTGTTQADGSRLACQAGQFQLPADPPAWNTTTGNIHTIFRAVWTPSSYTNRSVTLSLAGASAAGIDHSKIVVDTGTLDGDGFEVFVTKTVAGDFTAAHTTFTVAPAPASLALLGLGGLVAGRRRR